MPQNSLKDLFHIEIKDFKTKTIYQHFLEKNGKDEIVPNWMNGIHREIQIDKMNYLSTLKECDVSNKVKELLWKIYHRGLPLGYLTKDWFPNENGKCKFCQNEIETFEHLFQNCSKTIEFREWVEFRFSMEKKNEIMSKEIYLNGNGLNDKNFLLKAIFKKSIWFLRNKVIFDKVTFSLEGLKVHFKRILKSELETLYQVKKNQGKIDQFREKYDFDSDNIIFNETGVEIL